MNVWVKVLKRILEIKNIQTVPKKAGKVQPNKKMVQEKEPPMPFDDSKFMLLIKVTKDDTAVDNPWIFSK